MNEALLIDDDADVQFLVREMHEDEIAGAQFIAPHRHSGAQLFQRGTRYLDAGIVRRVEDQSTAVEAAGSGAAKSIRLAEHGHGAANHDRSQVRGQDAGLIRRVGPGRYGDSGFRRT